MPNGENNLKLNSGTAIPAFGFGTWNLADGDEVFVAVSEALKAGYRLIDTAKVYGNERGVGEAIRKSAVPREEVFVTTKLWPSDFGYENALAAFEESLDRLGLEYIDLYLIHWQGRDKDRRQESWRALVDIYRQGQAKSIGVSNYMVEHLEEVLATSDTVPAVNQIEFHPFIYSQQVPLIDFCKKHSITVEAYSPLAMGRHMKNETIEAIAKSHDKSVAQIMLRWAVGHDTVPIPKSSHPDRIIENLDVFDFELSKEEMRVMNEIDGGKGKSALPFYVKLLK